jgi:hypothetical protein
LRFIALIIITFIVSSTEIFANSTFECNVYERKLYTHWPDSDSDCQNARHEVLEEESVVPVRFKTNRKCQVVSGKWLDPYSGRMITDASQLDIDHLVPLEEAHEPGGYAWDAQTRKAYANGLRSKPPDCCRPLSQPAERRTRSSGVATS